MAFDMAALQLLFGEPELPHHFQLNAANGAVIEDKGIIAVPLIEQARRKCRSQAVG